MSGNDKAFGEALPAPDPSLDASGAGPDPAAQLLNASRQAALAKIATSALHNVGNVLNSVNVSATLIREQLQHSKALGLSKAAALLSDHMDELVTFLTTDQRGRLLPAYLIKLAGCIAEERATLLRESDAMMQGLEHMKMVVNIEQSYSSAAGLIEEIGLKDLLDEAIQFNQLTLERNHIQIERRYGELPVVVVEKHKVLQIVMNLLSNAKHALFATRGQERRIVVTAWGAGTERVFIEVSDNGIGIPLENQARIFSYGFTTKKDGHGFGLHSSIEAARAIGGTLTCSSEGHGQGAAFTLEFPLRPAPSLPGSEGPPGDRASTQSGREVAIQDVLVVEDEPELNEIIGDFVKMAGYGYRSALTGKAALQEARSRKPAIVVLDLKLPDVSGLEICQMLRADPRSSDIPVIVLSGLSDEKSRWQARQSGAADYLTKPLDRDRLLNSIRLNATPIPDQIP